jgi:tetratricopeptide (TPR) repeat protein
LLLLVFEDSAKTASQSVANAHWVASGASQAELTLTYQPKPTTKTVVVFAGLFDPNKNLLAFSSTQPFPAEPAPGRALFDRAMQERQAGRYAAAVQDLTSAIALAPNNGNYYYWRADNLVQLGQYDRAITDYDRALTFFPGNRATRVGRAIARMWKGEWNLAIDELTRVIDERPAPDRWTVWALRARGIAHAEVGQYAAAIADYYRYLSLTSSAADKATVENWISQLGP